MVDACTPCSSNLLRATVLVWLEKKRQTAHRPPHPSFSLPGFRSNFFFPPSIQWSAPGSSGDPKDWTLATEAYYDRQPVRRLNGAELYGGNPPPSFFPPGAFSLFFWGIRAPRARLTPPLPSQSVAPLRWYLGASLRGCMPAGLRTLRNKVQCSDRPRSPLKRLSLAGAPTHSPRLVLLSRLVHPHDVLPPIPSPTSRQPPPRPNTVALRAQQELISFPAIASPSSFSVVYERVFCWPPRARIVTCLVRC